MYAGLPHETLDHQESYLLAVFGFLGITDVSFVRAEGLAMGNEVKANAVDVAEADIQVRAGPNVKGE